MDKLCIAKSQSLLTSEGQQHLDSWRINTKEDLRSALHSWETTRGYIVREERSLWNPQFGQHRRLVCYKCQKPGHRATDCRSTQSSSSDLHKSDGFVPTCYTCGVVVGHKSPDCPSKTSNGSKSVRRSLRMLTSRRRSLSNKLRSACSTTDLLTLYGQPLPFLLDTGAQLSVVPKELVPSAARTGKKVCLKGYKGRVDEAELASISLCVGKRVWKGEAALVNGSDLDGKGVLAVDIRHGKSCLNLGSALQVNVVETRHQARERESVEQSDKVCMEEENAGSNTLDLFEGGKDEVVSASEADELRLADEKVLEDVEGESDKASEVGVEADALDYACVLKGSDCT